MRRLVYSNAAALQMAIRHGCQAGKARAEGRPAEAAAASLAAAFLLEIHIDRLPAAYREFMADE